MRLEKFNKIRKLLIFIEIIIASFAIYFDSTFILMLTIGVGMAFITLLKTQVINPITDERIDDIHEKAAKSSFKVLMPILGLTSLALFNVGSGPFYFLRSLGIILGYVTCVGLGVYIVSYFYYKRRYGG